MLEESQRQPAYRREALRARAERPLQQRGNPVFSACRRNPHSILLGLVGIFGARAFGDRALRQQLGQAAFEDRPKAVGMVAGALALVFGTMAGRACPRTHKVRIRHRQRQKSQRRDHRLHIRVIISPLFGTGLLHSRMLCEGPCAGCRRIVRSAGAHGGRRTGEIGVRMLLGANRRRVVGMVLAGAFRQVSVGLGIGIPAAIGAGKLMTAQLFGVQPWDPLMMAIATLWLGLGALVASMIPAWRCFRGRHSREAFLGLM